MNMRCRFITRLRDLRHNKYNTKFHQAGDLLLSVGDDQIVRMWNVDEMLQNQTVDPTATISSKVIDEF